MAQLCASISMSLDGYITGPGDGPSNGLGDGGMVLHKWLGYGQENVRAIPVLDEMFASMGALVMGRHSYETAEAAWGERPPFQVPAFVATHSPREPEVREGMTFQFVPSFDAAFDAALAAAGSKDVWIHGAVGVQQAIAGGRLAELQLHLVPVVLGDGKRLLRDLGQTPAEWELIRVIEGDGVTHLKYRLPH